MRPIAIVLDFDGTVTERDIGDEIIKRFATENLEHNVERYTAGDLGIREYWSHELSGLRPGRENEMTAYAVSIARVRHGLRLLVDYAQTNRIPVEVASNGMSFYISAILREAGLPDLPVCSPTLGYDASGAGQMEFPRGVAQCDYTGLCKCARVWRHRRAGRRVAFVGDGVSDLCVVKQADFVVARSSLSVFCEESGIPYRPFVDFNDVLSEVKAWAGEQTTPT
ncbi:MAG: HAD-IB family phosphatase [Dehalococcoidia bacterium]